MGNEGNDLSSICFTALPNSSADVMQGTDASGKPKPAGRGSGVATRRSPAGAAAGAVPGAPNPNSTSGPTTRGVRGTAGRSRGSSWEKHPGDPAEDPREDKTNPAGGSPAAKSGEAEPARMRGSAPPPLPANARGARCAFLTVPRVASVHCVEPVVPKIAGRTIGASPTMSKIESLQTPLTWRKRGAHGIIFWPVPGGGAM